MKIITSLLTMYHSSRNLFKREEGQTMTEYALILAVVALAVVAVLTLMGDRVGEVFQSIIDSFGDTDSDADA